MPASIAPLAIRRGLNVDKIRAAPSGAAGCYTVRRAWHSRTERPREKRTWSKPEAARAPSFARAWCRERDALRGKHELARRAPKKSRPPEHDLDLPHTTPPTEEAHALARGSPIEHRRSNVSQCSLNSGETRCVLLCPYNGPAHLRCRASAQAAMNRARHNCPTLPVKGDSTIA